MRTRRVSDGLEVLAPAKLNLFFEVLAKRPDGFHEVETLMAPVDIYDTIVFRDASPGVTEPPVSIECAWAAGMPTRLHQAQELSRRGPPRPRRAAEGH